MSLKDIGIVIDGISKWKETGIAEYLSEVGKSFNKLSDSSKQIVANSVGLSVEDLTQEFSALSAAETAEAEASVASATANTAQSASDASQSIAAIGATEANSSNAAAEIMEAEASIAATSASEAQAVADTVQAGAAMEAAEANIANAGAQVTAGTAGATGAGGIFAFGAALKGAALSAKSFFIALATNPITWIVGAFASVAAITYYMSKAFDRAKEKAQESIQAYQSTTSELDSLNSELQTTQSRIEELQALKDSGEISLTEEGELQELQAQNAELERKIALLKAQADVEKSTADNDSYESLTMKGTTAKSAHAPIIMTGQYSGSSTSNETDILTAAKADLKELKRLQSEYEKTYKDWENASPGSSQKSKLQKDLNKYQNDIDDYKNHLSEQVEEIQTLAEGLDPEIHGDLVASINSFTTEYSNAVDSSLSNIQKFENSIESYFSSSNKGFIKDYIVDMVSEGKKASDVIGELGLSLQTIGLEDNAENIGYLNRYFEELSDYAKDAADAVEKVDGTMSGVAAAKDSENSGDKLVSFKEYLDTAKELYDKGLTGTDDFKTTAALINNGVESTTEQFIDNYNKLKKYLTTDDDGNLTKSGMTTFANDLSEAMEKAGGSFNSTAEAADKLGISTEVLEMMIGRLNDYDIHTFDNIPKSAESLSKAKSELSQLQDVYEGMSDSDNKELLGKKIEGFQKQIEAANGDLSKLDTDIVCQLKLEYDLAYLQSIIDDAEDRIDAGGGSEDYVTAIAAQSKQIGILNQQTHLDEINVPIEYRVAEGSISALQEQLKGITNEEQKVRVQAEVKSLQQAQLDVMGAFQNAHPEITAETNVDEAQATFNKWLNEENGKSLIINAATKMDESVKKLIENGDIEVNAFVDYILGEQADPELKEAAVDYFTGKQEDPDPAIAEMFYKLAQQDPANPWYPLLYYQYGGQAPANDDKNHSVYYQYGGQSPAVDSYDGDVFYGYGGQDPAEDRNATVWYSAVWANSVLPPVTVTGGTTKTFTPQWGGQKVPKATGTAHSSGTALNTGTISGRAYSIGKTSGDWSVGKDQTALINEVAPEIIVHPNGTFEIANGGYPTFKRLNKNDIVFNGSQSKALLENGRINSYGKFIGAKSTGSANSRAFVNGSISGVAFARGSSSSSSSSSKNEIDWFEILLDRAEAILKKYTTKLENSFDTLSNRLKAANDAAYAAKQEYSKQQSAYNGYLAAASKIKLSNSLKKKIQSGANYIYDGYKDSEKELIDQYKDLWDKAQACAQAMEELKESIADLYKQAFDIVSERYNNEFDALSKYEQIISNNIDLAEAKGYAANKTDYESLIQYMEREIAKGKSEYAALTAKLDTAVKSGYVKKFSDEWWQMYNEILSVAGAIQESEISLAEYQQAINELEWDNFDYIQDRISQITQETDFLIGLLEDKELFDDNGNLTANGAATIALHDTAYDTYMKQAKDYADAIRELDEQIAADPSNKNLIERREDLLKLQQESIESARDEKDAIKDLIQDGNDALVESMNDRIDAYEDALDAAKDLYDYQKKVADSTKEIASLEKRLNAYQGNDSEEARAKIQSIKVELEEAKANLEETQMEHQISEQKKMLSQMSEDFEDALNARMDNIDAYLSELLASVEDGGAIPAAIKSAAGEVGYTISDSLSEMIRFGDVTDVLNDISDNLNKLLTDFSSVALNEYNDPIINSNGTVQNADKLITKSKQVGGYASGGFVSDIKKAVIANGDDLVTVNTLKVGEAVLTPEQTSVFKEFVASMPSMYDLSGMDSKRLISTGDVKQNVEYNVDFGGIEISIDKVVDYDDLIAKFQNSKKFENMVEAMTINKLNGGGKLGKYNVRWH